MIINIYNSQMLKPIKHLCAKELDYFSTDVSNNCSTLLCLLGNVGHGTQFQMDWPKMFNICFVISKSWICIIFY